jgi:hypothetical protein
VKRSLVQSRDREQSLEEMVRVASFKREIGVKWRSASGSLLREVWSHSMHADSEGKVRVAVALCPTAG